MEKDLRKLSTDELFDFIKNHREEFDSQLPNSEHEEKFLHKLSEAIKNAMISIIPHIIKAAIITTIVWIVTFIIWRIFLYPISLWTLFHSLIK